MTQISERLIGLRRKRNTTVTLDRDQTENQQNAAIS